MIFVSGGTGLLGAHLLLNLVSNGRDVVAMKRPNSDLGKVKKIFSYYTLNSEQLFKNIKWVDAEITDYETIEELLVDIDTVYHCAAMVSFAPADKQKIFDINVIGTANIVNACLKNGVRKLCHVSSIAALGAEKNGAKITEDSKIVDQDKSQSIYSKSKFLSEMDVWRGTAEGLNAVIVNPSVILGPGNWNQGSAAFFSAVWNSMKFYTEGVTGFVDVRDVTRAMIMLTESEIVNQRFIVSAENVCYKDIFKIIATNLRKKPPTIKVSKFMTQTIWRLAWVASFFSKKKPVITKETAQNAHKQNLYSNEKIKNTIEFNFMPIKRSIEDICNIFLEDKDSSTLHG